MEKAHNDINDTPNDQERLLLDGTVKEIPMGAFLDVDQEKVQKLVAIKYNYLTGRLNRVAARKELTDAYQRVSAQEFAICEQYLQEYGITDDQLAERMEELLDIFEGVLESTALQLPKGHPVQTYLDEVEALRQLLKRMSEQRQQKFIKNEWLNIYEALSEIGVHFSRKQNQLFPALEAKGFDKPSKVMWTLDNQIKEILRKAKGYLEQDRDTEFLHLQGEVIQMIEDMMVKETEILMPTAIELLSHEDFVRMRKGDDEIGYCLIDQPAPFGESGNSSQQDQNASAAILSDLAALLSKHGMVGATPSGGVLEVSQGQLTLEQINLIFKHLQVDLSYVDEHDIVKFYSDTKHRVFPRSAGVIGREVRNCHPRESVGTVEEIIRAFRAGEQDQAEFWLEMGGKFIYIIYNAVRDTEGRFRGVLEMMQDVTHIRALEGSQRLLSWQNRAGERVDVQQPVETNAYGITANTLIGQLVKDYPFIKDFMLSLSPKYSKLKNPVLFKAMSTVATLKMISERGELEINDLIAEIVNEIDRHTTR